MAVLHHAYSTTVRRKMLFGAPWAGGAWQLLGTYGHSENITDATQRANKAGMIVEVVVSDDDHDKVLTALQRQAAAYFAAGLGPDRRVIIEPPIKAKSPVITEPVIKPGVVHGNKVNAPGRGNSKVTRPRRRVRNAKKSPPLSDSQTSGDGQARLTDLVTGEPSRGEPTPASPNQDFHSPPTTSLTDGAQLLGNLQEARGRGVPSPWRWPARSQVHHVHEAVPQHQLGEPGVQDVQDVATVERGG